MVNHRFLLSFQTFSEVRALRSPGITRLHHYYDPLRGPNQPPPLTAMLGFPTGSGLPSIAQIAFSRMPCSLPRWIGPVLDGSEFGALPRRVIHGPHWPSLHNGQVGIHNFPFEACSSFTRVTACGVARPPNVDFVTRLRPGRLPSRTARQLPRPSALARNDPVALV